ncbi:riboflavin kinase [Candidatus Uhrbacteria bacterium]|nr:riboflavin kinase [Candidatus Uhrbacteria bacterium]
MTNKLIGRVIKGKGRGRMLGFPTANIELTQGQVQEEGVYAVWVIWQGKKYQGALSIGPAYTFGETKPTVEVFLLNFNQDLYDQTLELELVKKLRPMEKFATTQDLAEQIKKDCLEAERILKYV